MTDVLTELEQLFTDPVMRIRNKTTSELVGDEDVKHYVHIINPVDNMHIQLMPGMMGASSKEIAEYAKNNGVEVVCLCGYRFIPSRNPEVVNDTCPICLDVAGMLMRNAGE